MNLFKRKEELPEIPPAPSLPEVEMFPINSANTLNLPMPEGDSRDVSNREVIKSAIEDSSAKNDGDVEMAKGPAFNIPHMNTLPSRAISSPPGYGNSYQNMGAPPQASIGLPSLPNYGRQDISGETNIPVSFKKSVSPEPQQEFLTENSADFIKKDFNETIFVRIDKFNSARKDVEEIGRDLKQIENVLEKITSIKIKEDEEIEELNKNIDEVKVRLQRIDSEIFNRL